MTAALPCVIARVAYFVRNAERSRATMKLDSPGFPLAGERVGAGDPTTFHGQGK